jgi:hypothetical protein
LSHLRKTQIRGLWNLRSSKLVVGFVLATIAAGCSLLVRPEPTQPVSRQVLSTDGWSGLEGPPFGEYTAIAPDGSSIILPVSASGGDSQLAVKMRGSTEITPIAGTEAGRNVVYSPDSQWIAYVVGTDLFKRPLVGGPPVRLAADAQGLPANAPPGAAPARVGLTWLDDGTILYDDAASILQIPEDGGEAQEVFQGPSTWAHGLPNGRGALVTTPGLELHVVDLRDQTSELILDEVVRVWYAATGHIVYVRIDGAFLAAPFDLETLTITGGAIPIFDGVRVTPQRADMQLAADGTLLYVEGPASGGDADEGEPQRLILVTNFFEELRQVVGDN